MYFNCILAVHYACDICSAWASVTRHINLQWLWILLLCMHLCLSHLYFYPNHLLWPARYLSSVWSLVPAFHKVSSHAAKCALLQKLWCKWLNWQCKNCGLSVFDVANYRITCVLIYTSPKICVWKLEVKLCYPFLKNFLFEFFFFPPPNAPTCPCGLRGLPSWAWQKCNRLLRLDAHEARLCCPDVSNDTGGCSARRALKP